MLVVGTPGSGKTQWLRAAVASLLLTNTPETLELVLIDPKRNAFQFAKDFPHLSMPIVVPSDEVLPQFGPRRFEQVPDVADQREIPQHSVFALQCVTGGDADGR